MCSTCNGTGLIHVDHPQFPATEGCSACDGSGQRRQWVAFQYTVELTGDNGTKAVQTGRIDLPDDTIRLAAPGGYERARAALLAALASGRMRLDWEPTAYERED